MNRQQRISHLLSLSFGQFCIEANCAMNAESFAIWLTAMTFAKKEQESYEAS